MESGRKRVSDCNLSECTPNKELKTVSSQCNRKTAENPTVDAIAHSRPVLTPITNTALQHGASNSLSNSPYNISDYNSTSIQANKENMMPQSHKIPYHQCNRNVSGKYIEASSHSEKSTDSSDRVLTPSERRLRNVNLSDINCAKSIGAMNSQTSNFGSVFRMPASTLSQSYHIDIGRKIQSTSLLQHKYSQVNMNTVELRDDSSKLSLINKNFASSENKNNYGEKITVTVPDSKDMGIPVPDWMKPLPEPCVDKNLLDNFNDVGVNNPSAFADDAIDSDEEFLNEEAHRGEYLSDDEDETDLNIEDEWDGYMDIGAPDKICEKCSSRMWDEERNNKSAKHLPPTFSLCCREGQVVLPHEKEPPAFLKKLLYSEAKTTHFKQHIRSYNSMFAFTSIGGKIDHKVNNGGAPYCFKLNGQNHHLIGSMLPAVGQPPKFCQLYVYDTKNEVDNRLKVMPSSEDLDPQIVGGLLKMLDDNNKLVQGFRMARDRFRLGDPDEYKLVLVSSKAASGRENHVGPSNEVAALIVGDAEESCGFRDIIVETKQRYLKRIHETFVHFMQLQYPLLFPYGDDGFHLEIPLAKKTSSRRKQVDENPENSKSKQRETVCMRDYYAYKLMIRPDQGLTLHLGGRLWQQFVVDAFAAIEQYRLDWIRKNQKTIRSDLYRSLRDSLRKGDTNPSHIGQNVILPASFVGSRRYMTQYFKDALAICRTIGHPSLFLTMTCNTKWPEIQRMLEYLPGVSVSDAPDVVARVFKLKLDQLVDLIKNKNYFGRCIGLMHVIEFQKRGLPHAHMLIWLNPNDRPKQMHEIDKLVCAEIPDCNTDPLGYRIVKEFMMHGPCGKDVTYSPCMVNKKCVRHFPKRYNGHTYFDDCGFPVYRRRRSNDVVKKRGVELDNQYVVPYNRDLLIRFRCHINVEICNSSRSLKYLFKYCLKGHDQATMLLRRKKDQTANVSENEKDKPIDEVKHYLDGRYVCASEAAWRILGFDVHYRTPSVERLPVHLPGEKNVNFNRNNDLEEIVEKAKSRKSKLEAWFIANKKFPEAQKLTYAEFPQQFTWQPKSCEWKNRERGFVIGRLTDVHVASRDTFYLRMILLRNKGATSFKELRTVNDKVCGTFKDACHELGLLQSDNQWHEAMRENSQSSMPVQLRALFVHMLTNCPIADPLSLWKQHWESMAEDILYMQRKKLDDEELTLSATDLEKYTLTEIEKLLNDVGKSLKHFPQIPFPEEVYFGSVENRLISEETGYNRDDMKRQHDVLFSNLNQDQLKVYDDVVMNIFNKRGGIFFVYGSGGCGKTYLWKTLCCRLRSEGKIVLPVASSGIAAVLLPGGRTAHSRFHIPLKPDQYSIAGIKHGTDIAELIQQTSLIIWDEAPMQHRHAFESVDRCLKDIISAIDPQRSMRPFGGITVVFGGDFRQILPVIPKGSRSDIVSSTLNHSRLWDHCRVFLLKQNMRLYSGKSDMENKKIAEFSQWVLDIGDGRIPKINSDDTISDPKILIPDKYVIHNNQSPISTIVKATYPDFKKKYTSGDYLKQRAILTPTNAIVDDLNHHILDLIPGNTHTYLSQDSIVDKIFDDNDYDSDFPVEYLNSLNMPCLPKHELKLKVGCVVMLMRNLNQIMGLCNGTRMIVLECKRNSIKCQILCGSQVGTTHFIPRIEMEPTDSECSVPFKRVQFPLQLCFAMTINKSQGQSLDTVGLFLPRSVFSHGQLYVAVSRVTSPDGLHVLIQSDTGQSVNFTANVVFEEVFYNLPPCN